MRVLFTSWAWHSHFFPMVPLAWAFQAAGHETRVATQPALTPTVTAAGLTAVAVGADLDIKPLVSPFYSWIAERARPVEWPELREKGTETLWMYVMLARSMARELIAYAGAWRPDLIIYEPTTYAGPLAAEANGIPAVRHVWGLDFTALGQEFEAPAVSELCLRLGLPAVDCAGLLTVDPCPQSIQTRSDAEKLPMRYVPYSGRASVPQWLSAGRERPRVCLFGSTAAARLGGSVLDIVPKYCAALAELDAEIVVSLPARDQAKLGPLPGNVRLFDWMPMQLALPECDLVIHNGGAGATHSAVAAGTPQLIAPLFPDQIFNARQFATSGAGVLCHPSQTGPGELTRRADELLRDPSYREAAAKLRQENDEQPAPATVATTLTERFAPGSSA